MLSITKDAPDDSAETLAQGGAISGKVTDPDGKPVAGLFVSIKVYDASGALAVTGYVGLSRLLPHRRRVASKTLPR